MVVIALGAARLLAYAAPSGAIPDRTLDPIESGWGFVILMMAWGGIQRARARSIHDLERGGQVARRAHQADGA